MQIAFILIDGLESRLAMPAPLPAPAPDRRRAYWLKTLHEWHWVSAALCLIGMVAFSVTGITLNHAAQIEARPVVTSVQDTLDETQRQRLAVTLAWAKAHDGKARLPSDLAQWLKQKWAVDADAGEAEWTDDEVYLSLPRPGGDAWLRVALDDGAIEYERTDRGWLSYLNDLHKGRHTGAAWRWFIDVFAAAALVFSVTGLFILKMHAGNRPLTWPMVGAGLVIPLLLALLLIH